MAAMTSPSLFRPLRVGYMSLAHRIGMSPLTRLRASHDHIPLDMVVEYYSQRASTPGTFLISEGTFISALDGGVPNVPGIYNEKQIRAWKEVTDAVHSQGSYIFCQLWVPGRAAIVGFAESEGMSIYSSSATPIEPGQVPPRELVVEEIQEKIQAHVTAAENAIKAGFDGVEFHGANGYLIDQFTQDRCNKRTDEYGGSIENRSRFAVELVAAVSRAIGPQRVGLRLSPWSSYNAMRMEDPVPQFSDLITKISGLGIAYLHLIEPRITGIEDARSTPGPSETLAFAYDLWKGPLLVGGGFTPERAQRLVNDEQPGKEIVVMFGRRFISTPDLPFRIRHGIPPNEYDPTTFYAPGTAAGYIDYPFCDEFARQQMRRTTASSLSSSSLSSSSSSSSLSSSSSSTK
ncbi:putative N-ethylmaleimide reductase [Xylaria cf. heliscus]|nr:putative N-ethylmaleimide reductase [Xylaria cf. heliscus]